MKWYNNEDKIISFGTVKYTIFKRRYTKGYQVKAGIDNLGVYDTQFQAIQAAKKYEKKIK